MPTKPTVPKIDSEKAERIAIIVAQAIEDVYKYVQAGDVLHVDDCKLSLCYHIHQRMIVRPTPRFAGIYEFMLAGRLRLLFRGWKYYSGNEWYPVPPSIEPDYRVSTMLAPSYASQRFTQADERGENMWDINTPYGRARRDLLQYLYTVTQPTLTNQRNQHDR